jgi:hypothetical protein
MTDSIVAAAAAARQRVQQRLDRRRCEPRRASRPRPLIAPGAWRVHRGALPLDTIERASRIYIELVERVGSEVQGHGAHAWRASRNYVYGGKRCARTAPPAADIGAAAVADAAEIMAAVFEPLIALLGESIVASTMNGNCVVLDSACGALRSGRTLDARAARTLVAPPWSRFVALLTLLRPFPHGSLPRAPAGHLYDAEAAGGEDGSSWYRHRDYCADDTLAALSIVVQGSTREGFAGGTLALTTRDAGGGEDERGADGEGGGRTADEGARAEVVALAPGDAVVLRQAWHEPQPITRGRRVAFVFFYKRVPRRGGGTGDGRRHVSDAERAAHGRREEGVG